MKLNCVIIFVLCNTGFGQEFNQLCNLGNGQLGRRVKSSECQFNIPKRSSNHEDRLFFNNNIDELICCPVLRNGAACGADKFGNRIFGGTETTPNVYPWVALLIYIANGNQIQPGCGGALISNRHVLTAAHCIVNIPRTRKLHRVRLNEWDMRDARNCTTIGQDTICRQDYEVEQTIVHDSYDRKSDNYWHDIALLKLKEKVNIDELMMPICLPLDNALKNMPIIQEEFIVVGYGETEISRRSQIQLQTTVTGQDMLLCNAIYHPQGIKTSDMQLCVGGEEGKDSCRGDSGGPLMRQVDGVWYLVGMVSYGKQVCGLKDQPGVYTNVEKYLDWIENAMIHQ